LDPPEATDAPPTAKATAKAISTEACGRAAPCRRTFMHAKEYAEGLRMCPEDSVEIDRPSR